MLNAYSIRAATFAAIATLLIPAAAVRAAEDGPSDAAAKLEVRLVDAQPSAPPAEGEVTYRMEIVSVLKSKMRLKPGETIMVRASVTAAPDAPDSPDAPRRTSFEPGWIGTAYLNPDPEASGDPTYKHFVFAGGGEGFQNLPPTPPSASWIEYRYPEKTAPR